MRSSFFHISFPKDALVSILIVGLIHGLLYFFIVPPWWHYDEPGHFEYAWLVAHLPTWPKEGQYDQGMRQQMGESLLRYGWYGIHNLRPDLSGSSPIPIGVTQVGDKPGYYFLASIPLRLMPHADITIQYEVVRFLSLLIYLLIILVIWYAAGEVFVDNNPLRWMVPAFLVMLPAFVDTMVSVNNDISAVLAASLFFWASLRLMKRGFSLRESLFLLLALTLCYLSKNTAWFAFLLAPFVLAFSFLRGRFAWFFWSISVVGILIGAFATLENSNPLGWYQDPPQAPPLRIENKSSPSGNYVFQIDYSENTTSTQTLQLIPPALIQSYRGQTMTLGAWMWSTQELQTRLPYVSLERISSEYIDTPQLLVDLNTTPTFYRQSFKVPDDTTYATIYIQYVSQTSDNGKVFMDGLVLAPGEHSDIPPHFTAQNDVQGSWDGQEFTNLIRNASAEQSGFRLQPWIDTKTAPLFESVYINLPLIISTLQDWEGSSWYYRSTVSLLLRTFWASLAGNKVNLPGNFTNDFVFLLTLLGLMGALRLMWRRRRDLRWDIIYILFISAAISWISAVIRGVSTLLSPFPIAGWARYAYPSIFPTTMALCAGWLEWLEMIRIKLKFTEQTKNALFLGGMLGLAIYVLTVTIQYFHSRWWTDWGTLAFLVLFQILAVQFILKGSLHIKS